MKTSKRHYRRHRSLPEIIQFTMPLFRRFSLSFRDIEDLLAVRENQVAGETICRLPLRAEE